MILQARVVPVKRLQKIITKQNRCLGSILFAQSRDNAMSYFNLFTNLNLNSNLHKIKNDPTNIPAIYFGTLTLASEVHSYNTRF